MTGTLPRSEWIPLVATVALLFAVVFAVDAVASTALADLAGIGYLLASPGVHRLAERGVRRISHPLRSDAGVPG